MNGVSSFGPNIENILGDILVKRSTIKELLTEIKNISVSNIEKSNSIVEKMMSVTQTITERTKELEIEYSNFLSHKNSFSDLTYWEEVVYPDIVSTFESELKTYLTQLINLESICEKYFIQVLEDKIAEDDNQHLITDNPYKSDKNINSSNYFYPDSVGYNWYGIKASDDYMTNSKAVLNISKYDKDKYIETNQINKPSILHETISFHPKHGLVHYLSLGRERTLSPIRDEEDNSPVSTIEFKTFDGFVGEMNELKSHLDRNIRYTKTTISNENDLKYNLLMRHNMNSNNGSSYFILKMKDYEPIENTPDYYFINRNNLDSASLTRSFTDKSTTKSLLNISTKNNSDDISYSDNDSIVKAKEDNDETYSPSKRLSEIHSSSYYNEISYLNINGKEYNILRKASLGSTNNWIYNKIDYKRFVNYAHISKCNNTIVSKDLISNMKLKIIPYSIIDRVNCENITFNGKYERFHTLSFVDSYSRYQYAHKEFNKSIYITPLDRNSSVSTDSDSFPYNKTILDRRIINNNNINFDRLTSYTLQEYYVLDTLNTNKNLNDYYYENYNKGITLTTYNVHNTLIPEISRKFQANTIKSYTTLPSYNLMDTSTQEHNVYFHGLDFSGDTNDNFHFKTLKNGSWPTNGRIVYYCCTGKHIWALGASLDQLYYSEDTGLTWRKSTYDKSNSTKQYSNLSSITTTNTSIGASSYMLNTGLGVMCEYALDSIKGCYLYTEDYGKTFRTMWVGNSDTTSIEFVFINRYGYGLASVLTNSYQKIYYTRNFGKSWTYTTTTSTTDINAVYVDDDNVGYALGSNSYSGMQRCRNLKSGTPVWENYIPFPSSIVTRALGMIDWDNNQSVLPTVRDPSSSQVLLFDLKNRTVKTIPSSSDGHRPNHCQGNGFWLDNFGNFFYSYSTNIYINSGSNINKMTSVIEFGSEKDDNYISSTEGFSPFCVLFDEQIILVQSKTDRYKIYRIPYSIRNYSMRRNNKFYNVFKQLDISNDNVSELSQEEIDLIKERVRKELEEYYKEKDNLYIGTICTLPYSLNNEKWLKCDGRKISKVEYKTLYNKLGDIYNTGDEEEGYFRLPNMMNKTILGGNKELVGKSIEDSLPNIEFEASFSNNETVFDNDKRYGIMSLESSVDEEAIGLMGGFETTGMNKTKLKIPHNSTVHETVGNMFEVNFYIRAK